MRWSFVALAAALVLLVTADNRGAASARVTTSTAAARWTLPPLNAAFDYQLGGAYDPPPGVRIVTRDRTDRPAAGLYNICYVNGFQTQPSERRWWLDTHPTLILRTASGKALIDPEWPDEYILDVSTAAKRSAIAAIVNPWIAGCATAGYQAIEIDNLDTYSRFPARLTENDAVAMVHAFASSAHARGLAVAQKNSVDLVPRRRTAGLDFAVAEQCTEFDECTDYTASYGNHVLIVEYRRDAFRKACTDFPELLIVLRDRELRTPSSAGYIREAC